MELLNDLSYCALSDIIQSDEMNAADILFFISTELANNEILISELEKKMSLLKDRNKELLLGAQYTVKLINKDYPLIVKRQHCVLIVNNGSIKVEKNVI
jgi:hypothetical protein